MDADVQRAMNTIKRAGKPALIELFKMYPELRHTGHVGEWMSLPTERALARLENLEGRIRYEMDRGWRKWRDKIPTLQFPDGWKVRIIPPFVGATVRFVAEGISVYLDCHDSLGCVGEPYWEIHPADNAEHGLGRIREPKQILGLFDALPRLNRHRAPNARRVEMRLQISRSEITFQHVHGLADPVVLGGAVFPKMLMSVNAHGLHIIRLEHS